MAESPIERRQREFAEGSRKAKPAKTAGTEYIGVIIISVVVFAGLALIFFALS